MLEEGDGEYKLHGRRGIVKPSMQTNTATVTERSGFILEFFIREVRSYFSVGSV